MYVKLFTLTLFHGGIFHNNRNGYGICYQKNRPGTRKQIYWSVKTARRANSYLLDYSSHMILQFVYAGPLRSVIAELSQ